MSINFYINNHSLMTAVLFPLTIPILPLEMWVSTTVSVNKRGCYHGRNCCFGAWENTHFSDSKYHIVGFIFTDFNVDWNIQYR